MEKKAKKPKLMSNVLIDAWAGVVEALYCKYVESRIHDDLDLQQGESESDEDFYNRYAHEMNRILTAFKRRI